MQTHQWPPVYKVRVSQRAQNVNLKFCRLGGLEIVVPKKFNTQQIPEILDKHRTWIERIQAKLGNPAEPSTNLLPESVHLPALNQIWQINYLATAANVLYLKSVSVNQLLVSGCLTNVTEVKKLLFKWLKRLAANYLLPKLKQLSELHGLPYAKASIRFSHTHWGSCSAKKNISLSPHLLFIEPVLVEHVLLHELCHTKVLNHSKSFWQLLKSVNLNCHILRKQLREAQYQLPTWLLKR